MVQVITFNEYLYKILGESYATYIGSYKAYDPSINPTVSTEFSTAAFRFGHGQITDFLMRPNMNKLNRQPLIQRNCPLVRGHSVAVTQTTSSANVFGLYLAPFGQCTLEDKRGTTGLPSASFADVHFHPDKVIFEGGVDPIMMGLTCTRGKLPHSVADHLTDQLFGHSDLAALNILRGREHGIPGYNDYRLLCGLKKATKFGDFRKEIKKSRLDKLATIYDEPDDVDLFAGMMIEDFVPGGLVGPTTACILGKQFAQVRDGDRFWYQNPGIFTPPQANAIDRITLSRLLCDNGDNIQRVPRDSFAYVNAQSQYIDCKGLPNGLDLELWREPPE